MEIRAADVHARPLSDGLQALEDLDLLCIIRTIFHDITAPIASARRPAIFRRTPSRFSALFSMCKFTNGTQIFKCFQNTVWLPAETPLRFHCRTVSISAPVFHEKYRRMPNGAGSPRPAHRIDLAAGGSIIEHPRPDGIRLASVRPPLRAASNQRLYTASALSSHDTG